jgi:DNA mismatch endonuclease, patch repair protein
MDIMSACKRSALMSRIKPTDTKPELTIRGILFKLGYRYRLHGRKLAGKPDIVFPGRRRVIFVHGCFWHRHTCGRAYQPKIRAQFWQTKFDANVSRDKRNIAELRNLGWKTLVIWECEVDDVNALQQRLLRFLGSPNVNKSTP